MNVVLVEPEIPQNTGNIARLCAATGSTLHLIRPLGFFLNDKGMKRAGLDYWDMTEIRIHDCIEELIEANPGSNFYFYSTKAEKSYDSVRYSEGDFIVFGPETRGLKESLLAENRERIYRIPMVEGARSLNLANSVAIVLYEAMRQMGFKGLK